LFVLGVGPGALCGLGLDLRTGGLQPGQPLGPPVQLGRQIRVLALDAEAGVLGRVGGFGVSQQPRHHRLQRGDLRSAAISASTCSSLATNRG
jgi:hypothetical protein